MMTTRQQPPVRRRHHVAAAVLVLAGGLAGCASTTPDGGPSMSPGPSTGSGTELVVSGTDGAGERFTWRVSCDPAGGDHPTPDAACRALEERGDTALPPVPKDRMCTQLYGGPETATVSGTWRGRTVLSDFNRTNGCEIARWDALTGLLPPAGR